MAATATDLYYRSGPPAAALLRRSDTAAGRGENVTFPGCNGCGGVFRVYNAAPDVRARSLLLGTPRSRSLARRVRRGRPTNARSSSTFTPTERAQIAIWIESADGTFLSTVGLTQAVSVRGIGNRPGATQMNSGYHWPYGRREGVLPVWAHRRASAPGAAPVPRIIFQRRPEGYASRTCEDSTRDSYFCLSFSAESTRREGLDAISCASAFNSDKGRIMNAEDVAAGYTEPASVGGPPTWQPGDRCST